MCRRTVLSASLGFLLCLTAGSARAVLVAYWPMDEGSGTTVADMTGLWNGTITGNVTWIDGHQGKALDFPGGNNYVNFGNVEIGPSMTLSYWCFNPVKSFERPLGQQAGNYTTVPGWAVYSRDENEGGVWFRVHGADDAWNGGDIIISDNLPKDEWYHLAFTFDGETRELKGYYNGDLKASKICEPGRSIYPSPSDLRFGNTGAGGPYTGALDEVVIWNNVLDENQIRAAMDGYLGGENPNASRPQPEDGATYTNYWANLSWRAGAYAVTHDVYMSDNFEDVNSGAEGAFQGNLGTASLIVGFAGFAFPDGLMPGTTYYWRVDEVNDSEPNSPWIGDVWSFWIPPNNAYEPNPADGAKFVPAEPELTWTGGMNAKVHYVLFGDNFDDVNNAETGTGETPTTASFKPGTLEPEKTYYWRVDEFNPPTMTKGKVWSFTVAKEGGGILGKYYHWSDLSQPFATLVLTRTDPQINFTFSNSPDPAVNEDNFSARWTGEVEAGFTETYTFYTRTDDGVRLWIDGRELVDRWVNQSATERSGEIDLVAGQKYSLVMEYYENTGGAVAELRWSSPSTPKQLVPQAALSLPMRAIGLSPNNGAVDVAQAPILQWSPGIQAVSHDVYFGTDPDAVANATKASPEFVGNRQLGEETYEPAMLAWNTTYYWRIDEVNNVNPESPWIGNVWSFTTADFGIIDDFEYYNDIPAGQPGSNLVYVKYKDGVDNPNVNGSTIGYFTGASMESGTVHGGNLSVPFQYNNLTAAFSEVTRTYTPAQNWAANGETVMSLWFYGDPANTPGQLYVKINGVQVNYTGPASDLSQSTWQRWDIDLTTIGTNLQSVTDFAFGVQGLGAMGTLLVDDIELHRTVP